MNFNASDARHRKPNLTFDKLDTDDDLKTPRKSKNGSKQPPLQQQPLQHMPPQGYYAQDNNMYPPTADPMYNPNYGGYPQDPVYGAQHHQPYQPMPQMPMQQGYNNMPGGPGGFSMPNISDPMAAAAFQYGQVLMGQGTQAVGREFEKYVPVSRLKYYFAVDTGYVVKKMRLLLFPFWHPDWSIKYEADSQPVQPRYEINAPDLYIPLMAYVTYVLVAGLVLGTQERFTPEMLGIQASSALAWMLLELGIVSVAMYVMSIKSNLKMLDMLSYSGYKFIGAISAVLTGLLFKSAGYYIVLIYFSFALGFFQMRSLKWQLQSDGTANHADPYASGTGTKRRLNLLVLMVGLQTLVMWRLSAHLVAP